MIKTAQKLLEDATYSNLDDIRQCRADLMGEYAKAEIEFWEHFEAYEVKRPTIYLKKKKQKVENKEKTKMSDMDIDRLSKMEALEGNHYITLKSYVKVVKRYLDELRDLQIWLMHAHKDTI